MIDILVWIETRLLGLNEREKPYECEKCNIRLAQQPFNCPECGCYQVNWIGWEEELDWNG